MPHLLGKFCEDKTTDHNAYLCTDDVTIKRVIFYDQKPWKNFVWRDIKIRRVTGTHIPDKDLVMADTTDIPTDPAWTSLAMTNNKQFHDLKSTWAILFVMKETY